MLLLRLVILATGSSTLVGAQGTHVADLPASADTFVRGDQYAELNYGDLEAVHVKNTTWSQEYMRKGYLVFYLDSFAVGAGVHQVQQATLHLELSGIVADGDRILVYGITDNDDWDPQTLDELSITYSNAPHNETTTEYFTGEGSDNGAPVRLLGEFDATSIGLKSVDVTEFIRWAAGLNPNYGAAPFDGDGQVTILLRHNIFTNGAIGNITSKESTGGVQPRLHIEGESDCGGGCPIIVSAPGTLAQTPGVVHATGAHLDQALEVRVGGVPAVILAQSETAISYQPVPGPPGELELEVFGPTGVTSASQVLYPALMADGTGVGGLVEVELANGGQGLYVLAAGLHLLSDPAQIQAPPTWYGALLGPAQTFLLETNVLGSDGVATLGYPVPDDPSLSGTLVHLQAWCQQGLFGPGVTFSFTNAVSLPL